MRDAESALDQLIAFCGDSLKEEDVLSVFGLVSQQTLDDLVAAVLGGDVSTIIRVIANLDRQGKDTQRLVIELLEYFEIYWSLCTSAQKLKVCNCSIRKLKR